MPFWEANHTRDDAQVHLTVRHASAQAQTARVGIGRDPAKGREEERTGLFVTCALVNLFGSRKKLLLSLA